MKNCKVQTIHNGIDLDKFKPMEGGRIRRKYGLTDKYVLFGVAAQWSRRKGFDDILALRCRLSDSYSIVLIGLTPEQIKSLPYEIIGIQRTESQQELAEYYSMADCFVNLTYQDTFPTVNLEAMCNKILEFKNTGFKQIHSSACRKRAEECLDKDRCFEKYIELYNRILK